MSYTAKLLMAKMENIKNYPDDSSCDLWKFAMFGLASKLIAGEYNQ